MSVHKLQFGFLPEDFEIGAGSISISALPDLKERVETVKASDTVEKNWIYAPTLYTTNTSQRDGARAAIFCLCEPDDTPLKIHLVSA